MRATSLRSGFTLLLSGLLLAGVVSAVAVGADDEDEGSGIGMDALAGLGADGGGDDSDRPATGDLNDPLAGGGGGSSVEGGAEEAGTETGAAEGSDPTTADASGANPMFKLMLELILEDVQAAEAEAKAAGKTLNEAQRSAIAAESVKDLLAFLQETGLLGEVDTRDILKQLEAIPAEPEE